MDIMTEKIVKAFDLSDVSVKNVTFLNDIVVDYKKGIAYITDTGGDNGGLIMVNTQTGYMARYEGKFYLNLISYFFKFYLFIY